MTSSKKGYLIGLGCNISPDTNMVKIIDALLNHFEHISLSSVLEIPPVGMNSHRNFLNTVAFVETNLNAKSLKLLTNQIESDLGRDRDDPDSKIKDRPADIDILKAISLPEDLALASVSITDEYFLYPLIEQLMRYLATDCTTDTGNAPPGQTLVLDQLSFGQTPTTIYRDTDTGQKRVG